MQVPALGFADVAEVAFLAGPPAFQKFSGLFRYKINMLNNIIYSLLCKYLVRGGLPKFTVG